jgi:hypothetical protein
MPRNYYIGRDQTWLETQLAAAQDDLAKGSTLMSGGSADLTVTQSVQMDAQVRIDRLYYALFCLDPVKYPRQDANPVRRTIIVLNNTNY